MVDMDERPPKPHGELRKAKAKAKVVPLPKPSLKPCKHGLAEGTCTLCLGKRQPSSGPNPYGSRNVNPPPTGGISQQGY